jgi:hypothetical protein
MTPLNIETSRKPDNQEERPVSSKHENPQHGVHQSFSVYLLQIAINKQCHNRLESEGGNRKGDNDNHVKPSIRV